MKLLTHTEDTLTLLLNEDENQLIMCCMGNLYGGPGIDVSTFEKITGENEASIEILENKLMTLSKKGRKQNDQGKKVFEFQLTKKELWLTKYIIFFIQEDLERIDFSTIIGGIAWEEGKAFLAEMNSILNDCGCDEAAYQKYAYPIALDEQAHLGNMYVYFFLARTQMNLNTLLSLIGNHLKIFNFFTHWQSPYPREMSYQIFLKKYQEPIKYSFRLNANIDHLEIYIYPETIVFASYQKPWKTRADFEQKETKRSEMLRFLSEKAERIIMGFKEDKAIYSVRIAPTVNGLIEMGQKFPTLERQSLNADFEIKNLNPNDEKHSNALKMLQFCAKDYLPFM